MLDEESARLVEELKSFNARLGLKKRLGGVQYGRVIEYTRAYQFLQLQAGHRLLDIGTGKHSIFPLFCAYMNPAVTCHITDIGEYVNVQRKIARRIPQLAAALEAGRITIELQDATALAYDEESFDAVSAISTIEHIPQDGDSRAVREAYRVLKPGGKLVITVPLAHGSAAFDTHRKRTSYLRKYQGEPTFFQHNYDDKTLESRLLEAAPFSETSRELWDDGGFYQQKWCKRVPMRNTLKHLIGWWLTELCLKKYRMIETYEGSRALLAVVRCTK